MSDVSTVTPPISSTLALPPAAIICIAIGAYLVLIVLILTIRSVLLSRGLCGGGCGWCLGKEGEPCCETCCAWLGDSCNCCASPNLNACLDSLCPKRKQMDCADFITCQCCAENQFCTCCNNSEPLCDCGQCQGQCDTDCNDCSCCCFKLHSKRLPNEEEV